MSKFDVAYTDDAVIFVNTKTNKSEKIELFHALDDSDAIKIVNGEIKNRDNVSKASVSLLSHLLNSPRLDGYKGQTPINEQVPKELRAAIREIETEYLKPIFTKPLEEKGNKPATIEKLWQEFSMGLREGGGYANAKSRVTAYFAHVGALPVAANGLCLTVAAIDRILANELSKVTKPENEGLAGKLVKLSLELENRTEKTDLGDSVTAIAALKSMLSTYEGIYRDEVEHITQMHSDGLFNKANEAISKASEKPSIESIDAMYENGQIDDTTYQLMMLEHHDIEVNFEE